MDVGAGDGVVVGLRRKRFGKGVILAGGGHPLEELSGQGGRGRGRNEQSCWGRYERPTRPVALWSETFALREASRRKTLGQV